MENMDFMVTGKGDLMKNVMEKTKVLSSFVSVLTIKTTFENASNFLHVSLCPLPLFVSVGTTDCSLASPSSLPPISYFYTLVKSPMSILFSI